MKNQIEKHVQSVLGKAYTVEEYQGTFELEYRGRPLSNYATESESRALKEAIKLCK